MVYLLCSKLVLILLVWSVSLTQSIKQLWLAGRLEDDTAGSNAEAGRLGWMEAGWTLAVVRVGVMFALEKPLLEPRSSFGTHITCVVSLFLSSVSQR